MAATTLIYAIAAGITSFLPRSERSERHEAPKAPSEAPGQKLRQEFLTRRCVYATHFSVGRLNDAEFSAPNPKSDDTGLSAPKPRFREKKNFRDRTKNANLYY